MRTRNMDSLERRMVLPASDAELKILQSLALSGPMTQAMVSRWTGLHYVTVHETIKYFEDINWVYVSKNAKSQKNVPMKIYSLSAYPLLLILDHAYMKYLHEYARTPASQGPKENTQDHSHVVKKSKQKVSVLKETSLWRQIDTIAETNEEVFPLIFCKWSFFRKKRILDHAKSRLWKAVMATLALTRRCKMDMLSWEAYEETETVSSTQIQEENNFWRHHMYVFFYGPAGEYSFRRTLHDTGANDQSEMADKEAEAESKALDEWLEVICSDSLLRKVTDSVCKIRADELFVKMDRYHEELKQYYSHLHRT